jgi:2-methylisocitrate lyase-like PEP mutase family enzyme
MMDEAMDNSAAKGARCRALHRNGSFLSGGCWDAGTARLLEHAGFPLIETTSSGAMFARGLPDALGLATRDFMLNNAREIAAAVSVPVLADLENGFGDSPETVAETIRQAGRTGIVGGSIEDATARAEEPIYPFDLAVDRIRAAAEAAKALPIPFTLTARTDLYLCGRPDLTEAIRRAQAFQAVGADAILVTGLMEPVALETLCRSVNIPVAALVGTSRHRPGRDELACIGVRRIGVAGGLVRVALTAFLSAARDMVEGRGFDFLESAIAGRDFNDIFAPRHDGPGRASCGWPGAAQEQGALSP